MHKWCIHFTGHNLIQGNRKQHKIIMGLIWMWEKKQIRIFLGGGETARKRNRQSSIIKSISHVKAVTRHSWHPFRLHGKSELAQAIRKFVIAMQEERCKLLEISLSKKKVRSKFILDCKLNAVIELIHLKREQCVAVCFTYKREQRKVNWTWHYNIIYERL